MDPIHSLRQFLRPLTRPVLSYILTLLLFFFLCFIRYSPTRIPVAIIDISMSYCIKKLEALAGPVPNLDRANQEALHRPETRVEEVLLKTYVTDYRYYNDGCVICLEEFQQGESCRVLASCKHMFHPKCVARWLEKNQTCPLCRTSTVND